MNTTACEDLEDLIDAERNNWAKILASDQTDDDESGIPSSIMGGISGGIAGGVTSGTTVRIPSQLHNPTMTRIDTSAIEAAINANTFTISNHTSETPTAVETEFFGVDDVNNAEKGSLQTLHFSDSLWQHSTDQAPVSGLTEQVEHLLSLIDDPIWRFWSTWYKGFLNGKPLDGQLLSEITWIDDAIWNAGPEAVAAEIERIQRRLKTQTGPRLQRDQNNRWEIEPDVTVPEEPLAFAIAQVEVSLTAALSGNPNNGFTKNSPETVLIRSAFRDYRDMPSVVASSFWNACMSLQRNIGDVYPEDASLLVLKNVLYTSVDEICTQDDLIRERIGKLAALETRRYPTAQEREDLSLVPEDVKAEMTQPALDMLKSDIEIVVSTEKPPRVIRARLVNWLTTIGGGIDKAQKNEKRASWLLKLSTRIADWFFDVDGDAR
ncbi:hypothetical protein [Ascidiaceihabitans sp.]|uniref:hypothetical protein n=1 Tax=Ascidiaceihabitans sp. TaxID=1872644 RepID=UPI003298CAE8